MARKGDLTANATEAEIEAHGRKLQGDIRASLDQAARTATTSRGSMPFSITPRPSLARFSPGNIERLLRVIESAPSVQQLRLFMRRVERSSGRRSGVGVHAQRALKKCTEHYAKQYPNAVRDHIREVEGIHRFIRQQRSDLAADMRDIRRKARHLQLIATARAELQAIKEEFNRLGNDNQSTLP